MVGALLPSSSFLARSLCTYAHGAEHIIELGGGTGAVTHHLYKRFPRTPMVVVERNAEMAASLQQRFSRSTVIAGDIQNCDGVFKGLPSASVVVSSLPFRSLPAGVSTQITHLLASFLLASPKRRMVQFSYGMREPFRSPHAKLAWKKEELVLRNFPPAQVWTLQQKR